MKLLMKIAMVVAALALAAVPAAALASQPEDPGSQGNGPQYTPATPEHPTPGPKAGLPEKAKAYGRYCKEESRKHVAGEKGTPFSQCVTAMAKAAKNKGQSPGQVCKGTSGKHVKGEKGTAHSRCVAAAVKLRKEQREAEQQQV
jgi:hypothetical protein